MGEVSLTEQEIRLLKLFIIEPRASCCRAGSSWRSGWGYTGEHAVTHRGQLHRAVPQILRRRPPPAEILPERALRGVRLRLTKPERPERPSRRSFRSPIPLSSFPLE
ncbi:MAG: hypothetical protein MZV70_75615 [Desulfobacterales bacterium]|nr:hypothetical protein [Desulfobacterales bacterium]